MKTKPFSEMSEEDAKEAYCLYHGIDINRLMGSQVKWPEYIQPAIGLFLSKPIVADFLKQKGYSLTQ